jgi:serine/threonine protein kinase
VNYREDVVRFSEVQLGDLGGACPTDSVYAKTGTPVGAPMWSSPEVIMETPWNSATDIWSFGTMVCPNKKRRY